MSIVVRALLSSMYGSSGIPTQTVTTPPPGRVACSRIGVVRRDTGLRLTTSDPLAMLRTVTLERVVDVRALTILRFLAIAIAVAVTLEVVWIARHVIAWIVIALFLALALDPLVGWMERRGRLGRGPAIALTYVVLILVIVGVSATFVPKLVDEVNGFVQASPNYVHDLTHGRGRLGFLERKYHVVDRK